MPDAQWDRYRALFPALDRLAYLNTAGGCALPTTAAAAGKAFYDEMAAGGDTHWDEWVARTEQTRARVAALLNVGADSVALLPTATHGLNFIAQMLAAPGDHVLASDREFPSTILPWLNRGADVTFAPLEPDRSLDLAKARALVRPETRFFVTSHVHYHTGFKHDLGALSEFCRTHGLKLIVDAVQSFAAMPIDLARLAVDALVFTGYKWALAGYGIAGMVVCPDLLAESAKPLAGWRSSRVPSAMIYDRLDFAATGRVLEGGHPLFPGAFALGAGLALIEDIGVSRIAARNELLSERLRAGLDAQGFRFDGGDPASRSAITTIPVADAKLVGDALLARDVFVGTYEDRLRVSVNFYNRERDIDHFVSALGQVARAGRAS